MTSRVNPIRKPALLSLMLVSAWALSACESDNEMRAERSDMQRTTRAGALAEQSMATNAFAFPTGDRDTASLLVEVDGPQEVSVDEEYTYTITATNLTEAVLRDVVISDAGTEYFRMAQSQPEARQGENGSTQWVLGALPPGDSRAVEVNGTAERSGMIDFCVTADFAPYVCFPTNVIAPELELIKEGPAQVLACEEITYTLSITNSGVGPARDVEIVDPLPPGLRTLEGRRQVTIPVGTLAAGETKRYRIRTMAEQNGRFINESTVTAAGGLQDTAQVETVVMSPELRITKTGPREDYQGVPLQYTITVENVGDAPARDTIIRESVPAGSEFLRASQGGSLQGQNVAWNLGTLEPGERREVTVMIRGGEQGQIRNTAIAEAYCAEQVSATTVTQLVGVPALLLEVVDREDPIRVGLDTVYEITVHNQGNEVATNVQIGAELEPEVEFVSAEGQTRHTVTGNQVVFAPVASLAPGASATWRVTVRAVGTADSRFYLEMIADQLERPVRETESTTLYE